MSRPSHPSTQRNILLALGWYYPEIHRGVARFAKDHHWHLTADFEDPVPRHWEGDGVLTLLGSQSNLWRKLRPLGVPIVDLAESRPKIALPRLTMDNAAIGRLAAEHFLERGYQHFAFVNRRELGVSQKRRQYFVDRIQQAGSRCEIFSWAKEANGRHDTRDQRHRWLIKRLSELPRPLAVFAARDTEAIEVLEACLSAGLEIPSEVAVLGVDNTEMLCDCLQVPLSSIDPNLEQVGFQGAALLESLLSGSSAPQTTIYVPPNGVVERKSTDSLAVDHPGVVAALRFIQTHAERGISMADILKHVAMSRSGLEKAFREHYIHSPMETVRQVQLSKAKQLLRETNEKIMNVAKLSGFQTPHKLCRTFRQVVKMTPKQYRNQSASSLSPLSPELSFPPKSN